MINRKIPVTPVAMIASFWNHRQLIWQLARRDILARYRGSVMGLTWSFINPLLLLAVYTFVFSVVFKARWAVSAEETQIDFAMALFVGMIVFGIFSENLNRAPSLILSNANYVKKVVFPLEIMAWVSMGTALFHGAISLVVLLVVQLLINHVLPWTAIYFPIIILPLIFASVGFSWFISSLGVYVRDIGQVVGVFTTMLMFLSAIFYPVSALPQEYQRWLLLNPLVFIIEESRKSLIFGLQPDWLYLSMSFFGSVLISLFGFWWFQKTRKGFADVI